jgi:hypothetical protein
LKCFGRTQNPAKHGCPCLVKAKGKYFPVLFNDDLINTNFDGGEAVKGIDIILLLSISF